MIALLWLTLSSIVGAADSDLPARYFTLPNGGIARVEDRLVKEPDADL